MLRPDRILAVPGTAALVKVGTVAAAVSVTALGNYYQWGGRWGVDAGRQAVWWSL